MPSDFPDPPLFDDDDELARAELAFMQQRPDVSGIAQENQRDLLRQMINVRACVFGVAKFAIWVFGLAMIAAVLVWFWHLVGFQIWRWLTADEIEQLQVIISSAAVSALATAAARRLF